MSRSSTPALTTLSRVELIARLQAAKAVNAKLEGSIAAQDSEIVKLRGRSVETQAAADVEVEKMGNTLMKRVDNLRRSNHEIEGSIKNGERHNAAILAELARVRKDKVDVENRIEAEQERMHNTLHKQLLLLVAEKSRLARQLQSNREEVLSTLHAEVERLRSRAQTPSQSSSFATSEQSFSASRSKGGEGGAADSAAPESPANPSVASPIRTSTVAKLEGELRRLLQETKKAQEEADDSDQHCAKLADQLRQLQDHSLLAKVRMAKMREELDKAHAELAAERASGGVTPLRSSDHEQPTPLNVPPTAASSSAANQWPPSMRRSSQHARTHSTSSVESWSSASVVSSTPLNVALARQDPDVVRQHTARVLSSAPTLHPSPMRHETRERSGSRSGRSSAAPQPAPPGTPLLLPASR
jgi:hypothetical protein